MFYLDIGSFFWVSYGCGFVGIWTLVMVVGFYVWLNTYYGLYIYRKIAKNRKRLAHKIHFTNIQNIKTFLRVTNKTILFIAI